MKRLMAIGVAAAAMTAGAGAQDAVQWRVEDGGNGHWYATTDASVVWGEARAWCETLGGHLATLTSLQENQFAAALAGNGTVWVGAFQPPNSCEPGCDWRWVTGEPWSFEAWAPPGANDFGGIEDVAETYASGGWNDMPDSGWLRKGLIEWSADCNADGIVDFGQIRDGTLPDGDGDNIPDCCESGAACLAPVAQWRVEDGGNGHWYMLSWEVHEWPAARARAVELGGHLATLTSAAERLFVLPLCDNRIGFDVWLGASRASAVSPVQWITGEPLSYTAWGPGSPNPESPYDYLEIVGRSSEAAFGLWNLELVYAWGPGQLSLVEFDADCNSDGIVDFGQIRAGELADANANNIPDCCEVGTACGCPGDTNRDGAIDGIDLATVLTRWGQSAAKFPEADCNRDGVIDGSDLAIVLGSWGVCP